MASRVGVSSRILGWVFSNNQRQVHQLPVFYIIPMTFRVKDVLLVDSLQVRCGIFQSSRPLFTVFGISAYTSGKHGTS